MEDSTSEKEKVRHGENGYEDASVQHEANRTHAPLTDAADIDPETEKRIRRKFDRHIVPILFGIWLLAFLDRANIGNAKIAGLTESAKLTGTQFNVALAVFYVPYICVDVPSNWVLKYFKAGYYLPALLIGWGVCATFTGFVSSYGGLIAARFFLGLCEGGLLGGMVIYLAMFYKRHELLFRIGMFYSAAPLSGAWGGLLASGLAEIKTPGYPGWPFIFFVEGVITIVYGVIVIFFLPHTPNDAKFLSEEERNIASIRLREDSKGSVSEDAKYEQFSWKKVGQALLNINTILLSLDFFFIITPIYSYSLFLPTIIESYGYSLWVTQLLTVPPNMSAFGMVLIVCWLSDKTKQRGVFMLAGIILAIAGYIMLIATPNYNIEYGGTFLVAAGIFPCSPLVMAWLANNLAPYYIRATGTGFQIMIANCAAFIATFTYITPDAPRFINGHAINIGMLGGALVTTVALLFYNNWENKQREQGARDHRLQEEDEAALGFRHPSFRYTT